MSTESVFKVILLVICPLLIAIGVYANRKFGNSRQAKTAYLILVGIVFTGIIIFAVMQRN